MVARPFVLLAALTALLAASLSGCFGGESEAFVPGTNYKETGRIVHLKATVVDLAGQDIYPGFKANLWAYCFAPVDPADTYSANAVEAREPLAGDIVPAGWERGQCGVPGPTLRVKQGDHVKVEFSNSHFHPHTIHWHGQFVPWESDGVPGGTQDTVASGGSFTYDFIAKKAGTLWYHCHVDTQLHVMQGLYGVIIVEPQDDRWEPKDVDHDETIVISSLRRELVEAIPGVALHNHPAGCASGFVGCENPAVKVQPDVFLLNGHSLPYTLDDPATMLHPKEGERMRLRFVNAGTTIEEMHPHGHDMLVTHKDGNPIPPNQRLWVDTLIIGPGERYDVILEGNNPGIWAFHTHVTDHETNCWKAPGGMHTMIVYDGYQDQMGAFRGEALATCSYQSELVLPDDFQDSAKFDFGTVTPAEPVSQSWSFPVTLACAVRKLDVRARLETVATTAAFNDIQVGIRDAGGTDVATYALGEVRNATYALEGTSLSDLRQGNYTLTLTANQALEATVELSMAIDNYETFEQSRTAHLVNKVGGCPGYT